MFFFYFFLGQKHRIDSKKIAIDPFKEPDLRRLLHVTAMLGKVLRNADILFTNHYIVVDPYYLAHKAKALAYDP